MQTKVPIIIAIVFGIFAFIGIQQYLKSQQRKDSYATVLIVKNAKKKGETLRQEDIGETKIDLATAQRARGIASPSDRGLYIGSTVAVDMQQNDLLFEQSLEKTVATAENFTFDTKLQDGERAISIDIEEAGSLPSFLRVGDRVDVLATIEVPDKTVRTITVPNQGPQTIEEFSYRPTTVYMFENVKVLAIGNEFVETPGINLSRPRNTGASTDITIAVTPYEAQILTFAMRVGLKEGGAMSSAAVFTLLLRKQTDQDVVNPRKEVTYQDVLNMTELTRLQSERSERMRQ
ncbi:Flp pilus assembly protein CpaB [Candidatus Sumerlaeota bacterium]|nr:Flp pilus assembly protein CpaB [Candidatus Sumerlaeota bacterium]